MWNGLNKSLIGVAVLGAVLGLAAPVNSTDEIEDRCATDVNLDGFVDAMDFCEMIMNWGCDTREINEFAAEPVYCVGDCNQDFVVDCLDFCEVIMAWGTCP